MKEKLAKIKLLILDVDGTLTDGGIYITEEGTQFKKYNAKDGYGIMMLQKSGVAVGIISHSHSSAMVKKRAEMIGIQHVYVGKEPKSKILADWCRANDWGKDEIAFVGDDLNDLDIMEEVGLTACPADAVKKVKAMVDIQLTKNGGEGCVRELIDDYLLSEK